MIDPNQFKGAIYGMEESGASFVKADSTHMYFDIPKGSEIDNDEKLKIAQECIQIYTGLGLKVRRV